MAVSGQMAEAAIDLEYIMLIVELKKKGTRPRGVWSVLFFVKRSYTSLYRIIRSLRISIYIYCMVEIRSNLWFTYTQTHTTLNRLGQTNPLLFYKILYTIIIINRPERLRFHFIILPAHLHIIMSVFKNYYFKRNDHVMMIMRFVLTPKNKIITFL